MGLVCFYIVMFLHLHCMHVHWDLLSNLQRKLDIFKRLDMRMILMMIVAKIVMNVVNVRETAVNVVQSAIVK